MYPDYIVRRVQRKNKRDKPGEDGFTLVELIVVCMLTGMFLVLAVPSARNGILADPLKKNARKITGMFLELRATAARTGTEYVLHISPGENRLWYHQENRADEGIQAGRKTVELKLASGAGIDRLRIGEDEELLRENNALWISSRGYFQRTIIDLVDNDGRHLVLLFRPFIEEPEFFDDFESAIQ